MEDEQDASTSAHAELSVEERYRSSVGGSSARRERKTMAPYRWRLITSDLILISVAMLVGLLVSSRQSAWLIDPLFAIYGAPIVIGILWVGMLALRGSYDQRIIGIGTEELGRVLSATVYTFAVVAGFSYLIRADISRAYAYVSLPLGLVLVAMSRLAWRRWLYRQRFEGRFLARTIVIAPEDVAIELKSKLTADAYVGFRVVGSVSLPGDGLDAMLNWLDSVDLAIDAGQATAVAIAPGDVAANDAVRHLAWRLEGRGMDLLISPGMLDVAGPRLSMRPVSGLPLLHLDEVSLSLPQRFAKRALDVVGSALGLILLSPVMLACAIAVRLTSPGPAIFKQQRIGRSGSTFTMRKFRSMPVNADDERETLRLILSHNDPMFKIHDDPRVTTVGRYLRRWSLDELPQLINVLGGSMSLVGPRPHPFDDVSRYSSEAFRRLALKPGMTGLWQVRGRSDVSWQEALRLDVLYVEQWSLYADIALLAKTVRAVVQGAGAR